MHLEFYLRRVGWPVEPISEQAMFDYNDGRHGKILLVETQDEHDVMSAMQYLCGSELCIELKDPDRTLPEYLKEFSRVFTTWNPNDRNRI